MGQATCRRNTVTCPSEGVPSFYSSTFLLSLLGICRTRSMEWGEYQLGGGAGRRGRRPAATVAWSIEGEASWGKGAEEGSAGSHAEQPEGRTKSIAHTGDQTRRQQLVAAASYNMHIYKHWHSKNIFVPLFRACMWFSVSIILSVVCVLRSQFSHYILHSMYYTERTCTWGKNHSKIL